MSKPKDGKEETLKKQGVLNPQPEKVIDELFLTSDFFDPRDLVQVKYEMLRRVAKDGCAVNRVAKLFGFSRPTFYQVKHAFEEEGLNGFLPRPKGPKGGHKIDREVIDYLEEELKENPELRPKKLAEMVHNRFGYPVHPRSIERALERRKKNAKTKPAL